MLHTQRITYIDNIKAFVICLVLVGHIVQYITFPDFYKDTLIFKYIYAFHMPCFL
jgi:fucose 4-O-acetylase-like acetyltransferase